MPLCRADTSVPWDGPGAGSAAPHCAGSGGDTRPPWLGSALTPLLWLGEGGNEFPVLSSVPAGAGASHSTLLQWEHWGDPALCEGVAMSQVPKMLLRN